MNAAAQPSQTVDAVLARREELAARAATSRSYRKLSDRLMRRQAIGFDAPANENGSWPLAEQLRRDGNEVLLNVAERYRTIYDAAKFEPRLVGTMPDDFWSTEQSHSVNRKSGVLKVNGQKSGKNAMPVGDGTGKAVPVTDEVWDKLTADGPVTFPKRPLSPTMRKWNGDAALVSAIDSRPMLWRLQARLGALVEPFEEAVIDSVTFTEIGQTRGVGQHAPGAGKLLVMMGLEVVQDEFGRIDRESRSGI